MPKQHSIKFLPSGRKIDVAHETSVLDAALQVGIELESICGARQTCGKCIVTTTVDTSLGQDTPSNTSHITEPDDDERDCLNKYNLSPEAYRLGCAAHIIGDLVVTVPESSLSRKQVVRKTAGAITVDTQPMVRLIFVEVAPPKLGSRSDWSRLQTAIQEQWGIDNLTIAPPVLKQLQATLREGNESVTVTLWGESKVIRVEAGYVESLYGLAVDIGSTTLAAYLVELRTGNVLETATMMNPQVRYGEDIVSRISYASEKNGLRHLHRSIINALNDLFESVAESANIQSDEITDVVLVGNSVMHHIVLGIDPSELGHIPFVLAIDDAVDQPASQLGLKKLHAGAQVHILPCIASYVGADNVAVLLAEHHQFQDDILLIADIGTNAEILMGQKSRILSTSSPTGPAFEGAQIQHGQRAAIGAIERIRLDTHGLRYKVIGDERWSNELSSGESLQPTGICGSGIIEAIACLFTSGLITENGKFDRNTCQTHPNMRAVKNSFELVLASADDSAIPNDIVITQHDIRAIQLAKAAFYSSVRILMDELGVTQIDRIRLAGAFGSYIDPLYAMQIGLIPDCDLNEVISVGNAAGDGALIALINRNERQYIQQLVREVTYIETAAEPEFQDYFVEALIFPHGSDTFVHLASGENHD